MGPWPLKGLDGEPLALVCSPGGLAVPSLSHSAQGTGQTVQSSSCHGPRSQEGARPHPGCVRVPDQGCSSPESGEGKPGVQQSGVYRPKAELSPWRLNTDALAGFRWSAAYGGGLAGSRADAAGGGPSWGPSGVQLRGGLEIQAVQSGLRLARRRLGPGQPGP